MSRPSRGTRRQQMHAVELVGDDHAVEDGAGGRTAGSGRSAGRAAAARGAETREAETREAETREAETREAATREDATREDATREDGVRAASAGDALARAATTRAASTRDAGGPPPAPGPDGTADPSGRSTRADGTFARRHRVRLVAAGLVVAAALAVGTVRDARADRARAAALAVAPAVLDPVRPADAGGLERWRRPVLDGLVAGDGLVVTAGVTGAGGGGVAAYDAVTGAPLWEADVDAVGPQGDLTCVLVTGDAPGPDRGGAAARDGSPAPDGTGGGPGAPGVRGARSAVACVAVPAVGKEAWGGLGRRGDVRVVVLDAATGALVRDDPADRQDVGLTALGADLVLTRTVPGGAVRVTRQHARTGAEVWTSEVDVRAPDARGPQPAVTRVERGLLVVDGGAVRVLDGDGDPRDAWPAGVGRPDAPVVPSGDDGSAPDLGLVARPTGDGTDLRAAAGPARWSARTAADSVLVVDGRVVTADATGALTARDARTGEVLWSADPATWTGARASATLGGLQTDGEHVLVPLLLTDGLPVLVAVGPVDGRAAWTAALAPDVRSVERSGRRLLGRTATEVVALGQD